MGPNAPIKRFFGNSSPYTYSTGNANHPGCAKEHQKLPQCLPTAVGYTHKDEEDNHKHLRPTTCPFNVNRTSRSMTGIFIATASVMVTAAVVTPWRVTELEPCRRPVMLALVTDTRCQRP